MGQIYLLNNPLLRTPLSREDVKPRLLGHWGTTPGLNFLYAHLNRVIKERRQSTIYITGPGHGGPGLVANAYLDGTYSETYSDISGPARITSTARRPRDPGAHTRFRSPAPAIPRNICRCSRIG